jgi:hypothetical protein
MGEYDERPSGHDRAQDYTREALEMGWDATENVFVYNPKAITRIHVVEDEKLAAANQKLAKRKIR